MTTMQQDIQQDRTDVRSATAADGTAIRRIASRSFHESYGSILDESIVETTVSRWYGPEELVDRLGTLDTVFLVVTVGSEIAGFSEITHDPDAFVGVIDWLHVDPFHRGDGLGETLLRETEARLLDRGAKRVAGRVLENNEAGNEFYEAHGYTHTGDRSIDIDGETYQENRYLIDPDGEDGPLIEPIDVDGRTVYVSMDEREQGTLGPFYVAYSSPDSADKYGYYCEHCGSIRTAMDSMGRITCEECTNERKPSRWDSGYL